MARRNLKSGKFRRTPPETRTIHCAKAAQDQRTSDRVLLVPKDARRHYVATSSICSITCKHACRPGH
ncbi:MAG: hypothetical protein ACEQSB_01230 [Undibacterium sp.]